jgi:uncharacterized protein YodC (DUF2158 family)
MLVERINPSDGSYHCLWFDELDRLHKFDFAEVCLMPAGERPHLHDPEHQCADEGDEEEEDFGGYSNPEDN